MNYDSLKGNSDTGLAKQITHPEFKFGLTIALKAISMANGTVYLLCEKYLRNVLIRNIANIRLRRRNNLK